MPETRIKKVKKSKATGIVTIHYQIANGEDWDSYTLACKSYPHPDLLNALAELIPHVMEICELPQSYQEGLEVSGVSFSYNEKVGVMGAVITAQKKLKTHPAPLIINTPHKPVEPYAEGGDDSASLSTGCVMILDRLQKEAELYIGGKRGVAPVEDGDEVVGIDAEEQADRAASDATE